MLLSAVDPNILKFISLGVIILGLGSLLRYFRQPYIIAYIIAGVLMGEHGFQLFTDKALIANFGEFGLILLLFFIGMETSLHGLIKNWKVATVGTVLQVMGSILMVGLIGWYFSWEMKRIIVMGFVTSLSSSAVVIKLLQDNHETQTATGKNVISMLLVQDILIVPMLIITNYLGGITPTPVEIGLQLMGGVLIISGIIWIVSRETITLPFSEQFKEDHELQVFLALIFCFGGAVLTALFGLSAALGAFVGGLIIRAANSTEWFHDSLHSFRVIFVALFFVSIGMLIDLHFLVENLTIVSFLILSFY